MKILYLKGAIAFLIPFLTSMGGVAAQYVLTGVPPHWRVVAIATGCSALVSGLSALSSFLSTTFAEHKAKKEAKLPDSAPLPITGAQVANTPPAPEPPTPISVPAK